MGKEDNLSPTNAAYCSIRITSSMKAVAPTKNEPAPLSIFAPNVRRSHQVNLRRRPFIPTRFACVGIRRNVPLSQARSRRIMNVTMRPFSGRQPMA